MGQKKSVQVTLPFDVAQRLVFLRNFKHKIPDMNQAIVDSLMVTIISLENQVRVNPHDWKNSKPCPKCASGLLFKKKSSQSNGSRPFYGCSRYPECRHTESVRDSKKG
jgi:hypothetical protein